MENQKKILKNLLNKLKYFINFIFPCSCVICKINLKERGLCHNCWKNFNFISEKLICQKCGYPLVLDEQIEDGLCSFCIEKMPIFDQARSVCVYENEAKSLILSIKNHNSFAKLKFIADCMKRYFQKTFPEIDIICSVPMYKKRVIKNGFNHAALLAVYFCNFKERWLKYKHNLFIKTKPTIKQSSLNYQERINKDHGIILNPRFFGKLNEKKILIIDDIITTGSTMNECAKIIKNSNPNCKVYCLSFARTILY